MVFIQKAFLKQSEHPSPCQDPKLYGQVARVPESITKGFRLKPIHDEITLSSLPNGDFNMYVAMIILYPQNI